MECVILFRAKLFEMRGESLTWRREALFELFGRKEFVLHSDGGG